jgi:peptide subunit release factor 1 (eRF1)
VVSALPRIGPLVEFRQASPGYVVVLADRTGADLVAVTATGREIGAQAGGADDPISKVAPGGWSQQRYQQRAENVWEQNARDVADTVAKLVDKVDARIVLVAGDVRALEKLRSEVAPGVAPLLHEVAGHRGAGTDDDATAAEITRVVAGAVAEDTVALLRKFREEDGQNDRAANGVAATVTALQMSQVETLLIHDDPDDERTLWYGPAAGHLALDRQTLVDMGAEEQREGRLVDVLIRAAFGTGAGVRIVPSASAVNEGVGAILRFASTQVPRA